MKGDRFVAHARQAVLPLLAWALHFGFCYVFVAAACRAQWEAPLITGTLVAASALAGLWLAGLLAAALRHRPGRAVRAGASVLALLGVAWAALPVLVLPLPPCSDPAAYSWLAASRSSAAFTACASPLSATGAPFKAAEPSFLKRLTQAPASRG
jgi:predicted dienelactone hydrolase